MKRLIIAFVSAFALTAGAFELAADVVGPVVVGKTQGSTATSYIAFSKDATASPVLATESYAMPRAGATIDSPFNLNGIAADKKLWLSKYVSGTGHKDAPTTLGPESQYILVGGREYGAGSVRGIGFGYVGGITEIAPVFVGVREVKPDGHTSGDLIIATRESFNNEPPSVRLSIMSTGQITAADDYVPKSGQDLVTKAYVDSSSSGVPLEQSLRLVDARPSDSSDKCRKGDLNIDTQSAATYAYLCVGDNWRRIKLDMF